MAALGYVPVNYTSLSMALLVMAIGFSGAVYQGFLVSHIDLAPTFAAPLFAITNSVASFIGIFPPIVTGKIVTDHVSLFYTS